MPKLADHIIQLLSDHHALTAHQLLTLTAATGRTYNKTTVYRALETLLTKDSICRQSLSETEFVYELRDHQHDHLVCTHCQRVRSVPCHHGQLKYPGFRPEHHHLTVYGKCQRC